MPSNYRVVEPHPSVPTSNRPAVFTGIGGAGNIISLKSMKVTDSRSATGPASLTRLDSRVPAAFTSGRGGIGNAHTSSERAIFSFDEELQRDLRRAGPVYHVGRGGAGNMVHSSRNDSSSIYGLSRKHSSSSTASNSSTNSVAERARDLARRGLDKFKITA
ncbi:hypothetical protein N7495_003666 [Penicillium taxi]|uniref:uncharacterized protein n=1 Tax=Penicillium taxi TaxID=168475 RepID=UPI0025452479|nr:uncharacterized protein N7495_003666 [Penicillium taxi]KAJ5898922.1 hypothetical protein N7495_003666 [Penicillium taxi]